MLSLPYDATSASSSRPASRTHSIRHDRKAEPRQHRVIPPLMTVKRCAAWLTRRSLIATLQSPFSPVLPGQQRQRAHTALVTSSQIAVPPGALTPDGTSDQSYEGGQAPWNPTVPSGHHTWAELLRLVGSVRRLEFDRNLPPSEAMGRIRDAFHDYDQQGYAGTAH
jgi:hypothetical protein